MRRSPRARARSGGPHGIRSGGACLLGATLLVLGLAPRGATAQSSVSALSQTCGGGEWCTEVALAAQAARAGYGILAAGGDPVPGSAGTLGFRLGSIPRIAVSGTFGGGRVAMPALGTTTEVPLAPDPFFSKTLGLSAAVGLFGGFAPLPTVGGIASLDLLGTGSVVFLPGDRGFDGSASSYGVGLRVGIFRESFTLPGISVSVVHRWGGQVTLTGTAQESGGTSGGTSVSPRVSFDPSTTSIRATIGKDLMAVGVLAGLGWDRYGGSILADPGYPTAAGSSFVPIPATKAADGRFLFFGGASMNFLILAVSGELGWAQGMDAVPGRTAGGFDPTSSSWFGSLGLRLTY